MGYKNELIETYTEKLSHIVKRQEIPGSDIESDHSEADDILCRLLRLEGYSQVADEYDKIKKWYAQEVNNDRI